MFTSLGYFEHDNNNNNNNNNNKLAPYGTDGRIVATDVSDTFKVT